MVRARVTLLVVLALVAAGCARAGGDAFQVASTTAVQIGTDGVGQLFQPGAERIGGVDLVPVIYGEAPDPDGELVVELVDADAGETVARAELPGAEVPDGDWVEVRFDEPAPAPQGQAAFEISWTGESPVGLRANAPPPDADPDERLLNNAYAGGTLLHGDTPVPGDLAFRVVGDPTPWERARAVARLPAGALRSLAAAPAFAVVWAAALLGAVALAVHQLRAARRVR